MHRWSGLIVNGALQSSLLLLLLLLQVLKGMRIPVGIPSQGTSKIRTIFKITESGGARVNPDGVQRSPTGGLRQK